jgi:hypothetical protein
MGGLLKRRTLLNVINRLTHPDECPFETRLAAAPQDKRARLEGRTTPLQPDISLLYWVRHFRVEH